LNKENISWLFFFRYFFSKKRNAWVLLRN
jgi:hypothetical protein